MTVSGRFTWRAGDDRVAHAVILDRRLTKRTACDIVAVAENLAWPEKTKCPACLTQLGFLPVTDYNEAITPDTSI